MALLIWVEAEGIEPHCKTLVVTEGIEPTLVIYDMR